MRVKLQEQWRSIPAYIRKPVAFIVGFFFIIAAALTGWLPGPGGIPLFLIGIAVLATEYKWAKKLQDMVLKIVYAAGRWYRKHRQLGMIILTLFAVLGAIMLYLLIRTVFF